MTAFFAAARLNSVVTRAVASSARRTLLFLLAAGLAATPLAAQRPLSAADSARVAADSLAARLRRAEQAIAVLQQQVADQASAGVSTRSRMQLELNGSVLMHTFRNDQRVNNADNPQFVQQPAGLPATPVALTVRQTRLGAILTAPDVLGGRFTGDIDVDFYGGQQPSSGGRTFPLLRLRTARSTVTWSNVEVLVGQEMPLVSGLNPVSPAAIGTPAFAAAGNLWLWLPQVRATIESNGAVGFALQGAMLANINGDAVGLFDTDVDPAERSGRPAFETRLRVRFGHDEMMSEIGCGAHVAWVNTPTLSSVRTHALACDAKIALDARADLRMEGYTGRGLRGLGGGGIGQNLGAAGTPLSDRGGWVQLNVEPAAMLRSGVGCGLDVPSQADVPPNGRLRNQACAAYAMLRPGGPLVFGAEVRRIGTRYATGLLSNNHISLSAGFEF